MMKHLKNEKGIALVTALLLTLISLAIILAAVYFVTMGTKMSGFQKRYSTSLEASHGGVDIVTKEIIPKTIGGTALSSLGTYSGLLAAQVTDACFTTKLTTATASWGTCSSALDPKTSTDIKFTLVGVSPQPNFVVYAKIVDTVPGNSGTSGIELEGSGVVEANSGLITPQHFPYIYRLEIQSERESNPDERANLTAVYAY